MKHSQKVNRAAYNVISAAIIEKPWLSNSRLINSVYADQLPKGVTAKEAKAAARVIIQKQQDRAASRAQIDNCKLTRIKRLAESILGDRANDLADGLPDSGYSMGEIKDVWCMGVCVARKNHTFEYAKSCTWKPRHGWVSVAISVRDLKNIRVIGGITTVVGDLVGRGVRKCTTWEVAKKGAQPLPVNGYLAGDYHFQANSDKEARAKAKAYYTSKREKEAAARKYRAAIHRSDVRTWVTYQDSLNGHNCESGTNRFCAAIRWNRETMGAMRADRLATLAEKHGVGTYAALAIEAAKMRYAGISL